MQAPLSTSHASLAFSLDCVNREAVNSKSKSVAKMATIIIYKKAIRNKASFENLGISPGYYPVLAGYIQSRDVFRPIALERKYLMDYSRSHHSWPLYLIVLLYSMRGRDRDRGGWKVDFTKRV